MQKTPTNWRANKGMFYTREEFLDEIMAFLNIPAQQRLSLLSIWHESIIAHRPALLSIPDFHQLHPKAQKNIQLVRHMFALFLLDYRTVTYYRLSVQNIMLSLKKLYNNNLLLPMWDTNFNKFFIDFKYLQEQIFNRFIEYERIEMKKLKLEYPDIDPPADPSYN